MNYQLRMSWFKLAVTLRQSHGERKVVSLLWQHFFITLQSVQTRTTNVINFYFIGFYRLNIAPYLQEKAKIEDKKLLSMKATDKEV